MHPFHSEESSTLKGTCQLLFDGNLLISLIAYIHNQLLHRLVNFEITTVNRWNRVRVHMQSPIPLVFAAVVLTLLAITYTRHTHATVSTGRTKLPDEVRWFVTTLFLISWNHLLSLKRDFLLSGNGCRR